VRMCRLRIRVPDQWWGDYLAALSAVRIGEQALLELGADIGWEALRAYSEDWFDYSENRMIEAIRRLPSGRVTVTSRHDPFPGVPEGIPVRVRVDVDSEAASIEVDLRDNPDCQPCGLNLTESTAKGAAMVAVYNSLIDHSVPPNAGSFRRLRILLRQNCCVGIPVHPSAARSRPRTSPTGYPIRPSAPLPKLPRGSAWPRPGRSFRQAAASFRAAIRARAMPPS